MSGRAPATRKPKGDPLPVEQRITQRAHELYLQRNGQDGSELDDWLQAEAEIQTEDDKG